MPGILISHSKHDPLPNQWICPHDRVVFALDDVQTHVAQLHTSCWSCQVELFVCNAIIEERDSRALALVAQSEESG
jgi:hypothetical protein